MPLPLRRPPIVFTLAALISLSACGASEPVEAVPAAGTLTAGEGTTTYPLTMDNCGEDVTVTAPPRRVVSLDQGSTEILLSLGLADHLVGTASWTDPVLPSLAAANDGVPRLADNAPTYEVVLDTDPDFVTASFGRHYATGGVATRERFSSTRIATYLSPTDCEDGVSVNGGGQRTTPLTMESVYSEIRQLAEVFDVSERGKQLIGALETRRQEALRDVDANGATVAFWFADTKSPYVAGGLGAANLLTTDVGATNVFADLSDDWPAVGWETLVERDPQFLVLGDLTRDRFPGDKLTDKQTFLAGDPLTATMTAVREKSYIALHGAEMNPSIRTVDGLEKIASALREDAQP